MKYVILVSHGEFAPGLHTAVKMMTGDRPDVLSTSLKDGMGTPEFQTNFEALLEKVGADDEIVLLADIQGGSPATTALGVLSEKGYMSKTLAIFGMNMPLAITAVLMKDNMDLAALKGVLISEGQAGLVAFETEDDDSDDEI